MAAENTSDADGNKTVYSLPAPSSPSSAIRRKMASSAPSAVKKDAVLPRRPATSSTTTTATSAGARRPGTTAGTASTGTSNGTANNTTPTPTRTAARSTSRLAGPASSLNKPPTRAPAGTAARRSARPSTTARPAADTAPTRPTPRTSLAAAGTTTTTTTTSRPSLSTTKPAAAAAAAAARPAATARTPQHTIPKAPVSIITPKTPVAHAKKLSVASATSPTKPTAAEAIHVPPRSHGPLKDKAASDAEVEVTKTIPFGPLRASLPSAADSDRRPGTAPTGPAEVDEENKRRSLAVMQDFFRETSLREKLQEERDELHLQVERLNATTTKLRNQLAEAQSAVPDKDKPAASASASISTSTSTSESDSASTAWDENKHKTIVHGMEQKFALETKLLEEQKQELKEEKRVAQEKEAAEAAKAAELQQVLDDLNVELERQGREWDAEKLKLVEQAAKIDSLTKTVEHLRAEAAADQERQRSDAAEEANRALKSTSESSKLIEELQEKLASLQQQHTEHLREKDAAIATHVQTEQQLRDDLELLQQRADHTTAELESERTAHADQLKAKIDEIQASSQNALGVKDADISAHLKSIEDLQNQIVTLQQGETDGARISRELSEQIEQLKAAHEEAMRIKTDQNEELVQRLDSINDQISSDASEIKQLREEANSLRKTIESLEDVSKQDNAKHTSNLDRVQLELDEAKKKADSFKADLEAANDRHRQDLRVLGEDHDAEIDSLRADLEGDAKKRLDQLQAKYDSLVAEKNATLEGHEKSLADTAKELDEAQKELSALKESSGSTSQGLDEAMAKHNQVLQEKTALAEAHYTAQKQVADLEARVEALTKENALIADLQARIDTMTEHKQAADSALADSESSFTKLKAEVDALTEERQSLVVERTKSEEALSKVREELEASIQAKQSLEDMCTKLEETVKDLKGQCDTLSAEKSEMESSHAHTLEALKQDTESATKQALSELQAKHDALLEEKKHVEISHASELESIQARCDTLVQQITDLESKLEEAADKQKTTELAQAEALDTALDSQRQDIENKYVALLEEIQADYAKVEQEKDTALTEKKSLLDQIDALNVESHAQIKRLEQELAQKEELDSAGLIEVTKKYEMLLAEQSATDHQVHEAALEELRSSLEKEIELKQQEAYAELESLKDELASKERADSAGWAEVTEKYESLLAEQSAADKRDHEATLALFKTSADTDLNETKERYEALLAEKDSLRHEFERAKDEACAEVDELRRELESSRQSYSAALTDMTHKHDSVVAEMKAADEAHGNTIDSLRQSLESEHGQVLAQLQKQNQALQDQFAKMDEEHQQIVAQLKTELETNHASNADALRQQLDDLQEEHTSATERLVKAHEDAISELKVGMQNSTADAVSRLQKEHDSLEAELNAVKASHDSELEAMQRDISEQEALHRDLQGRFDKVVAELEASSDDVKRLQETIEAIEAERDRAYRAAAEAEDRIEMFKGEVVRKHLARVEPLQKENTALLDKIDRLQDMLAAGDRIARAAASLGEKREMTTLAEQSEEEQDSSSSAELGVPRIRLPLAAPLLNGATKDVVGTQMAAMQENLTQLIAMNNDAFAENERTAHRLTEQD